MEELLKQITVPDGIGATLTTSLIGVIGYLVRRLVRMERVEQEKARLSRNQNYQMQAILDLQVVLLRNGKTPEQREDSMMEILTKLNERLRRDGS